MIGLMSKVSDCSDKSDENGCYKVRFNEESYNKHMAPVDKYDTDRRVKITLDLEEIEIVGIDYLSSHFLARFKIKLTWIDRRLTFQNIRPDDNVLDEHEIGKTFQLVLTYIIVNFLVSFYHRSYVSM